VQRVATLEVLVVGEDELLSEVSEELRRSGHQARIVEACEVRTALRAIAPHVVVLGDTLTPLEVAAVRAALQSERRGRRSRVVVIGEPAEERTGTITLPACLSARELARQLIDAVGPRAITDAPAPLEPEESGRFVSGRVPAGAHAAASYPPGPDGRSGRGPDARRRGGSGGFQGDVEAAEVASLVQLLGAQRRTGVLRLTDEGRPLGDVYFEEGHIVHADTSAGASGAEAFYRLVSITTGQFAFHALQVAPDRTIHEASTALLLEGLRRRDATRTSRGNAG
jgi:hypothetical protein